MRTLRRTVPALVTCVLLSISAPCFADGGFMGSAIMSGAGQGMNNAASQGMSVLGAGMLQQQALEAQVAREEQQMKWQMEREQRAMEHQQRMRQVRQGPSGASVQAVAPAPRELEINDKLTFEQRLLNAEKQLLDTHQQLLKAHAASLDREEDSADKRERLKAFRQDVQSYNARVADYDRRANEFVGVAVSHGWLRTVAAQ